MRDRRPKVRTLMATVAACAIVLAWLRAQGSFGYALTVISHSTIAWGGSGITAIAAAWVFGPVIHGTAGRTSISCLLLLSLLASLYLAWGYHRATYDYIHGLDRLFPYPDPILNQLLIWFDARYPTRPGTLKIHGEYPCVQFVLGILTLVFTGIDGWLIGILSNEPASPTSEAKANGP